MRVERLAIPDVLLIEPARHGDARGFFSEVWSRRALAAHGIDPDFVQDNHAASAPRFVLRGLHFQRPPSAQGKLIRVPLPEMSRERRLEFVKNAHRLAEEGRVQVRNVRRDANEQAKKTKKDSTPSKPLSPGAVMPTVVTQVMERGKKAKLK